MGNKSRTQRSPDRLNPEDLTVLVADSVDTKSLGVSAQNESVTDCLLYTSDAADE